MSAADFSRLYFDISATNQYMFYSVITSIPKPKVRSMSNRQGGDFPFPFSQKYEILIHNGDVEYAGSF